MTPEETKAFEAKIYAYVGRENGPPKQGNDDVNPAMIRQWAEIMGDELGIYTDAEFAATTSKGGIIAPPAMLQAWSMEGYPMAANPAKDVQRELHSVFDENGFTGVLGTNTSTEFFRDLKPGDAVTAHTIIDNISEQKATARGIGYFIETVATFTDQLGEEVGRQVFRVLKFIPNDSNSAAASTADDSAPATPARIHAPRGHDNGWWWNACDEGKVLIQRCKSCQTLRHPPRPMCGECQSIEWDSIESTLDGEIFSFTTLHYPKVPGYQYPCIVGVISLAEGTRLVANIVDIDYEDVVIGMKVKGAVEQVDEKTMLPVFRVVK
ncbi:bifunctional MaoC family dehydratase N-terminal/OB-fold nucleic acid binding domain-containing protein [Oceanicoccus sp. KOV_DT_Chl]|uniref:bifunctional MaoC family dehydratase N-terminal/OB-fold nucleic acid binding domain-containing protein n=1 Tax=Oceanicoccus sp. KOV_DT_Chl TaxID=1904639 RepID=UPI000C79BAF3|nr:bifunctional MaoC family dehydratase N-terminal/OB-fold nucleic acid binding domain-containing protein [Oceanicoccus sp. KOV_DT_Chl]